MTIKSKNWTSRKKGLQTPFAICQPNFRGCILNVCLLRSLSLFSRHERVHLNMELFGRRRWRLVVGTIGPSGKLLLCKIKTFHEEYLPTLFLNWANTSLHLLLLKSSLVWVWDSRRFSERVGGCKLAWKRGIQALHCFTKFEMI